MKRIIVFFLLLNVTIVAINGDVYVKNVSLQLDTLIDTVIKNNPDLAAVSKRVEAATLKISRVQVIDDPEFLFRSIGHSLKKDDFVHERRFKFMQRVPFPGKLRLQGEIARQQREQVYNEEIRTHDELILQTKKLYFQLYFNMQARQINKENRLIIERLIEDAQALYKVGKRDQADVLKAHLEHQILDDEWLMLQRERATIVSLLNAMMNYSQEHSIADPEPYFHIEGTLLCENIKAIAIDRRPELRGLQAMVYEEEKIAKLARRNYFPDFNVEWMFQQRPGKDATAWGVNIGFRIPLWIGKREAREAEEAELRAQSNMLSRIGLQASICGRIEELLTHIDLVKEKINLYKTGIIPKTIETLSSYEAKYRTGSDNFLLVLDTRRQLQDAQLRYEFALVEKEVLLSELEREMGTSINHVPSRVTIQAKTSNNVYSVSCSNVHKKSKKKSFKRVKKRKG